MAAPSDALSLSQFALDPCRTTGAPARRAVVGLLGKSGAATFEGLAAILVDGFADPASGVPFDTECMRGLVKFGRQFSAEGRW